MQSFILSCAVPFGEDICGNYLNSNQGILMDVAFLQTCLKVITAISAVFSFIFFNLEGTFTYVMSLDLHHLPPDYEEAVLCSIWIQRHVSALLLYGTQPGH